MTKPHNFRVGDRVRYDASAGAGGVKSMHGKLGRVVYIVGHLITVRWENGKPSDHSPDYLVHVAPVSNFDVAAVKLTLTPHLRRNTATGKLEQMLESNDGSHQWIEVVDYTPPKPIKHFERGEKVYYNGSLDQDVPKGQVGWVVNLIDDNSVECMFHAMQRAGRRVFKVCHRENLCDTL